ncbi:MAG: hypothetical protein ACP5EN_04860 [Rhodovulum sp.]
MRPSMTDDELKRRIEDLQAAGMTLAAKTLMRELGHREKQAA